MADQATIGVPVDLAGGALTGSVRRIRRLIFWFCVAGAVCTAGAGVGVWLLHFERLAVQPRALLPVPAFDGNRVLLTVPGYAPTAEVTTYKDELFAYLMFDHLRHYPAFSSGKLLLAFDPDDPAEPYRLIFRASDDLLAAFATGAELGAAGTLRTGFPRVGI
jgi:hypothetical protein